MNINLSIKNEEYKKLQNIAKSSGKTVNKVVADLIYNATKTSKKEKVKNDPIYTMEGYDADVPEDFSLNHDHYLYNL